LNSEQLFRSRLVLTEQGKSRSHGDLTKMATIRGLEMAYHNASNWRSDHFKSAEIGQKFVIDDHLRANR